MGKYSSYVAGIINKERRSIANKLAQGDQLQTRREPVNPVDECAVALYVHAKGMVGYIPAKHAGWVAERIDKGRNVKVEVEAVKRKGFLWNKRVFVDLLIRTGADA